MGIELQRPLSELIQRVEDLRGGVGSGMRPDDVHDRLLEIENTARILRLRSNPEDAQWKIISFTVRVDRSGVRAEETASDDFNEEELGEVYDSLRRLHRRQRGVTP
jgi:hypothetical protein